MNLRSRIIKASTKKTVTTDSNNRLSNLPPSKILQLGLLISAIIIKRPSISIKSPYVADISIASNYFTAHAPSLGMISILTIRKILVININ